MKLTEQIRVVENIIEELSRRSRHLEAEGLLLLEEAATKDRPKGQVSYMPEEFPAEDQRQLADELQQLTRDLMSKTAPLLQPTATACTSSLACPWQNQWSPIYDSSAILTSIQASMAHAPAGLWGGRTHGRTAPHNCARLRACRRLPQTSGSAPRRTFPAGCSKASSTSSCSTTSSFSADSPSTMRTPTACSLVAGYPLECDVVEPKAIDLLPDSYPYVYHWASDL